MYLKWKESAEGGYETSWEGDEVLVVHEGKWRIYVNGERTKGFYDTPKAAMDAVATVIDRKITQRGATVHARQPPPYGTWERGKESTA